MGSQRAGHRHDSATERMRVKALLTIFLKDVNTEP